MSATRSPAPDSATSRSVSASGDPVNDDRAQDALALAEAALAHAMRAGATEAEVLVVAGDAALTRFANSQIHQNVAETTVGLNLRFVAGKRIGVASSDRTDDEGLRRLTEQAAAIARVVEELEDWGGLPEPSPITSVAAGFAPATAEATPELRADGVRAVIAAADAAGLGAVLVAARRAVRVGAAVGAGRAEVRRSGRRAVRSGGCLPPRGRATSP